MRTGTFLAAWLLAAAGTSLAAPFAYLPNDQHQLQVIDLATGAVNARIQLGGTNEIGIAIKQSGDRAYIADYMANTVQVINMSSNTVVTTINVCNGPFIPAVNPSGTELVVPCAGSSTNPGNQVWVINLSTNAVSAQLTAGSEPFMALWNPSGTRFYAANLLSGTISVFDATNNTLVQTITVPGVTGLAFNPSGSRLYAARTTSNGGSANAIAVLDPNNGSTLATVPLPDQVLFLSLNPSGTRLYAPLVNTDSVAVIDTSTNTISTTVSTGANTSPIVAVTSPDGTRLYVENADTSDLVVYDASSLARLNTIDYATNVGLLGNFVSAGPASTGANTPGALSGQWWNHNESGWGVDFTQRGNTIFAAWYTYDSSGNPKWYVTTCTNIASSCSGDVLQVNASHGFFVQGVAAIASANVGTVTFVFNGNDAGTMTYSVGGVSRSVAIERQILQASGTTPAVSYTDLWWGGASQSGWGLAITHQFSTMFLAWYVYNDSGQPMWYVATITNATASGGTGQLFRTTGPAFSTSFNPNAVLAIPTGTITVNFTDANNGTISYTVTGEGSGSKTITRQIF